MVQRIKCCALYTIKIETSSIIHSYLYLFCIFQYEAYYVGQNDRNRMQILSNCIQIFNKVYKIEKKVFLCNVKKYIFSGKVSKKITINYLRKNCNLYSVFQKCNSEITSHLFYIQNDIIHVTSDAIQNKILFYLFNIIICITVTFHSKYLLLVEISALLV